ARRRDERHVARRPGCPRAHHRVADPAGVPAAQPAPSVRREPPMTTPGAVGLRDARRLLRPPGRVAHTRPAVLAVLAALCAGCSLTPVRNQSALDPAGPQAGRIYQLLETAFGMATVVFVVVMVALAVAITASRRRGGSAATAPADDRRLARIVGGAVVVTALVLVGWLGASIA